MGVNSNSYRGWVLYDDSCGFCRWWIPYWRTTLNRKGFAIAPLQDDWVEKRLGLPRAALVDDLRLLCSDGSTTQGANVYRCVLKCIWWTWPLYFFAICPVTRSIFDWGYRWFARNRFRVSSACKREKGTSWDIMMSPFLPQERIERGELILAPPAEPSPMGKKVARTKRPQTQRRHPNDSTVGQ